MVTKESSWIMDWRVIGLYLRSRRTGAPVLSPLDELTINRFRTLFLLSGQIFMESLESPVQFDTSSSLQHLEQQPGSIGAVKSPSPLPMPFQLPNV